MLFNIEEDRGDTVIGYLVPDSFTGVGRVRVSGGGQVLSVFSPPEVREALVQAGRHETGLCGFTLDEAMIPGLSMLDDLEIVDDETGCMIYRRAKPEMCQSKVFRFETHLFSLWRLDEKIKPHFQYFAKGVERGGRETATQMFLMNRIESFYASGRLNIKNFTYYLENGFECCAIVQAPHREFAERLLVLRHIHQVGMQFLGDRDAQRLAPVIAFAESLPLTDVKALARGFLSMPREVAVLMANPLTRQLTTNNPDDMPRGSAVADALDVLSTFKVTGIREKADDFAHALEEWFGLPEKSLPLPAIAPVVDYLASFLRHNKVVDVLIEKDLEVYEQIMEARRDVDGMTVDRPVVIDGKIA